MMDAGMKLLLKAALIFSLFVVSGCGYNSLQRKDEKITAEWSEVLSQYQRRADLIPNLVNTVKGYASHEKDVLTAVTEARAKASQIKIDQNLINDPNAFAQFQQAQGGISSALSRLLVVAEKYPDLKADQSFLNLQSQLEGTENRITVARRRYIKAVEDYNITVRSFPSNLTAMIFGMEKKPNFTVENEQEIAKPPAVDFGNSQQ